MVGKKHWIHRIHLPNWVVGILALVLVLRIPSFFEPYYYGDEMIYMSLGQGVGQGLTLYKDIFDNKPPLLYLTAAIAGNLFWFKALLCFWSLLTIVFFYKLAVLLFQKNGRIQKVATIIFALLTTIPLLEGNTVNAELFMIGTSILALLILLGNNLNPKNIFIAGVLFGISALFKIPAIFDLPVIIFYWILTKDLKSWKIIFKNSFVLGLGFLLPILLTFVWYYFHDALPDYIKAAFLQNIGYISSFRPGDVQKPFLVRNAPLLIRGFVVLLGSGVLFLFRKKLSKNFILFCIWTLFALFAVTLSERPYPHYLVQVVAPMSFLLAMFFTEKSFEQSLTVFPLALTFFVPVFYKFYFYPTASYYQRFINFALQKTSRVEYLNSFEKYVNRNYKIAEFLNKSSNQTDRVFMWDPDSPTVYALSRRLPPIKYVAPYHVYDYSNKLNTVKQLIANPPKFIILTSGERFSELNPFIKAKYILVFQIENAEVWSRVYNPSI